MTNLMKLCFKDFKKAQLQTFKMSAKLLAENKCLKSIYCKEKTSENFITILFCYIFIFKPIKGKNNQKTTAAFSRLFLFF